MKKLLFLSFLSIFSINSDSSLEVVIEKTGIYGVYVESIPFWAFWNRTKSVVLLAELTEHDREHIYSCISLHYPVLITKDLEQAEQIKNKLQEFDCCLEIKELRFTLRANDEYE